MKQATVHSQIPFRQTDAIGGRIGKLHSRIAVRRFAFYSCLALASSSLPRGFKHVVHVQVVLFGADLSRHHRPTGGYF